MFGRYFGFIAVAAAVTSLFVVAQAGHAQQPKKDAPAPKKEALKEPKHKPGEVVEVEIAKAVKMKFCWIPPGKATLGSPASEKDRSDDETEHEYKAKGFWLAKYPVTQEEWEAITGKNPSYYVPTQDDIKKAVIKDTSRFPVERVSWNDCQDDFLTKLNRTVQAPGKMGKGKFVLPHEDEWEYACRGGKGNKLPFYFGDELNGKQANCNGNFPYGTATKGPYLDRTSEVGSYEKVSPHPWGLCDMSGNVYQWCENLYNKDTRVVRGGSWFIIAWHCRSAYRNGSDPGYRLIFIGFRVCFRLD